MGLDDVYRETILKHAREPRHFGALEDPDMSARAVNTLCGDELELTLALDGDSIREAWVRSRGCAILQASGSLMTELIEDHTLAQSLAWGTVLAAHLEKDGEDLPDELQKLAPLLTIRPYRARHRCVLLPWMALNDCKPRH